MQFYVANQHFTTTTMVTLETAGRPLWSPPAPPPIHMPSNTCEKQLSSLPLASTPQQCFIRNPKHPGTQTHMARYGMQTDDKCLHHPSTMAIIHQPTLSPFASPTSPKRDCPWTVHHNHDPGHSQLANRFGKQGIIGSAMTKSYGLQTTTTAYATP